MSRGDVGVLGVGALRDGAADGVRGVRHRHTGRVTVWIVRAPAREGVS